MTAPHNADMSISGNFDPRLQPVRCLLLTLALPLLAGCAREEPAVCSRLNTSIDRHIVAAALLQHEGEVQDRSASQQAARVGLIHNHLVNIQTQVSLMGQHRCAPRQTPVDPEAYADASRNCYLSSVAASVSKLQERPETERVAIREKALAACEFSRWQAR